MLFVELLHLAGCTPASKANTRIPEIDVRDFRNVPPEIEGRRTLVRNRLAVYEAVLLRRAYGGLVELFGVQRPAFDPRDFGPDEGRSAFEIGRAMHCPCVELATVRFECHPVCL